MAIRKIAVMGHPILRQQAQAVPESEISSPKIQQLIRDMVDTMFEYDGVGLAAPQVYESLQVVVLIADVTNRDEEPKLLTLINPEITPLSKDESEFWEGCLSVPGLRGKVSRPTKIRLKAFSGRGERIDTEISGFTATVIQHECDHLKGVLYVDKLSDPSNFAFEKEYLRHHVKDGEVAVEE